MKRRTVVPRMPKSVEISSPAATIKIPPGTRSGQKFRLKGRGVPSRGAHAAGNLNAVVQIVPPKAIDARSKELLEEFARLNPGA